MEPVKHLQQTLQWQPALAAAGASADGALIVVIPGAAACLAAAVEPTARQVIALGHIDRLKDRLKEASLCVYRRRQQAKHMHYAPSLGDSSQDALKLHLVLMGELHNMHATEVLAKL